jgi:hypothetical protein
VPIQRPPQQPKAQEPPANAGDTGDGTATGGEDGGDEATATAAAAAKKKKGDEAK